MTGHTEKRASEMPDWLKTVLGVGVTLGIYLATASSKWGDIAARVETLERSAIKNEAGIEQLRSLASAMASQYAVSSTKQEMQNEELREILDMLRRSPHAQETPNVERFSRQ